MIQHTLVTKGARNHYLAASLYHLTIVWWQLQQARNAIRGSSFSTIPRADSAHDVLLPVKSLASPSLPMARQLPQEPLLGGFASGIQRPDCLLRPGPQTHRR